MENFYLLRTFILADSVVVFVNLLICVLNFVCEIQRKTRFKVIMRLLTFFDYKM